MNRNPLGWRILLAALMFIACQATVPAQDNVVFDFTQPGQAQQWSYYNTAQPLQPQRIDTNGRLALRCEDDTYLIRPVNIDASQYNRMTVEAILRPDQNTTGFTTASAYFAGASGEVLPGNFVDATVPVGQPVTFDIHMDQALAWSGRVSTIRLDPIGSPGVAEIYRITLRYDEPVSYAPGWVFTDNTVASQWFAGEHLPGPMVNGLPSRTFETRPSRIVPGDGLVWNINGDIPGVFSQQMNYDTAAIRDFQMEFRYAQRTPIDPAQSQIIFYWSNGNAYTTEKQMNIPIDAGNNWQTITIPVNQHPQWRGPLAGARIDFHIGAGEVSIRRIESNAAGALDAFANTSQQLNWITVDEIGSIIERNYKPLLVLVDDPSVAFCQKIEKQLATNTRFINLMQQFYCVRARPDDERVRRAIPNIYRVPTLAFLEYDFNRRMWYESARLAGSEVPQQVVAAQEFVLR